MNPSESDPRSKKQLKQLQIKPKKSLNNPWTHDTAEMLYRLSYEAFLAVGQELFRIFSIL